MTKNAASLPAQAAGNTFYVALSGSDSNSGTASAPFKTFNYAKRLLQPGDTLRIFGGTYTEPIDLNISGTPTAWITILPVAGERVIIDVQHQVDRTIWLRGNYLKVAGLETRNGKWSCLTLTGDYLEVDAMIVTGCMSHSIVAGGKHITIKNSIVHDAVLENQTKTPGNSWGSGIKVELGGEDITIDRNTVYRNYGEGIAATRAKNIRITHNWVYDNYSVNIYVDNSIDVVVTDNLATCTGDPTTLRDGSRPVALAFAEESYSGWGSQLANITASNNVLAFCSIGLADFGAEGSAGGLDHATFEHNTVWGNLKAPISFNSESTKTRNSSLTYNIFNSSVGTHTSTVANVPGLVLNNNYWASNLPPAGSKPLGANDVSGIPVFSQVPRYDDFNSFRQTSVSSALTYGVQFGVNVPAPTATLQPTVLPSPTSTLVPTMPPTPTITRMPTPTILPTPTVAPISTVAPIPTLTRVPTLNPTSTLIPTTTTQPTNATAKRGDINLDGFVDLADIDLLLEVYGQIASVRPRADLTQDGVINAVDYAQLMGLLGS